MVDHAVLLKWLEISFVVYVIVLRWFLSFLRRRLTHFNGVLLAMFYAEFSYTSKNWCLGPYSISSLYCVIRATDRATRVPLVISAHSP